MPATPANEPIIREPNEVVVAPTTAFYHGQKNVTTPGTEVAIGSSQVLKNGVTVKAKHDNEGMIFVGGNPVTSTTGYVLDAGEVAFIEADDVADVYIDSGTADDGVSWIAS